jgi:AcrR family transcriptional regulator
VAKNQRERLFSAMVATVAEKGYEATRVADLLALSGVSRASFYEHFDGKGDCFLAMVEALVGPTVRAIQADGSGGGEAHARAGFERFIELVVDQAPAARICFVDVYSAGPAAVGVIDRATDAFSELMLQTLAQMPGRDGLPPELARAMVGGIQRILHRRLYRGEEAELAALVPQIWEWGLSYLPPPQPLRKPRRRAAAPGSGAPDAGLGAHDEAERILRAFAATVVEHGYTETTVSEVAERASCSLSTFYSHFPDKEAAMLAAVDSGAAQMLAATLPAFRRGGEWPTAVRRAFGSMFAFGPAEPAYTQLGAVEVFGAGRPALERRDGIMAGLEALLTPGYELAPETPPIAAEAIGGAIYALIYDQVRAKGPASLPEIAPLATYVTLCPFIGAEAAAEAANQRR